MNASREEKVSSMMRSPPSIRSSHLWTSPVGERKGVRVAEMKLNARPHRSCSETSQEWSGGSLGLNVRPRLDGDGHGGSGTLFGDVPYFDGVGFAIESKDRIIRRHWVRFTRHREKELARDGEAREGERRGIRATSERWDPTDGSGQRMRNRVEPIILVFIPHEHLTSIYHASCRPQRNDLMPPRPISTLAIPKSTLLALSQAGYETTDELASSTPESLARGNTLSRITEQGRTFLMGIPSSPLGKIQS